MSGKNSAIRIIDTLIVLLNIAGGRGNYFLFWLLGTSKSTHVMAFVIFVDLLYLLFRQGINFSFLRNKHIYPIYMFVMLLLVNSFHSKGDLVIGLEYLFQAVLFSLILVKLASLAVQHTIEDQINGLSRGYIWISMFSVLGVFLSFVLILIFGSKGIPIYADYMSDNVASGTSYYMSYLSVNSQNTDTRVSFFQDYGILCGLFHEPSVFAFNVFPCLILLIGFAEKSIKKTLLIFTAILSILFAGSTTNILAVAICLTVYFLLSAKKAVVKTLFSAIAIAFLVFYYISIDNMLVDFVSGRLESDNISQQSSIALLRFAFTPKTLFGTNFLNTSFVDEMIFGYPTNADVGYIPFFLNIIFLVTYTINTIKLLFNNEKSAMAVGVASLYFILHCAKMGMVMFVHTLPIMIIFLQAVALTYYGRIKTIK